jgi:hypothetical protein
VHGPRDEIGLGAGTITDVRRRAIGMAAALAAAVAAAALSGSAGAQTTAQILLSPNAADPGGTVTVSNSPLAPCPPPPSAENPSVSIDLFAGTSVTPANRTPYQGAVTVGGTWSVNVRLDPDLAPGTYRVEAGCYADSGLSSGFGPDYAAGRLDVRLQAPGQPVLAARRARPGDNIHVNSAEKVCRPPAGSPSPRVRVSLLDATKATRAEAEGPVDPASGRWAIGLHIPDMDAQAAEITAVCLARVAAPAPYARYQAAPFTIDAVPAPPTTTTPATVAPVPTLPRPGAPATLPPATVTPTPTPTTLPTTPLAVAIVAEPTYTG